MIIFTSPNADSDSIIIRDMINDYVKEFPDSLFFIRLCGQKSI